MKLKRPLYGKGHPKGPSNGRDVSHFVKRTLHRLANELPLGEDFFPKPKGGKFDPVYNAKTENAIQVLRRIQGRHPFVGPFRQDDLDALWVHADRYARWVYKTWSAPPVRTWQDEKWQLLLGAMQAMDVHSAGYILGAGHGRALADLDPDDFYDCSSSCSKALYEAGLFYDYEQARVSGLLTTWGEPGPGKFFTLYANGEHVWLRLHKTRWWRFDTSPHVDGRPSENPRRGPRLRFFPRFSSSFTARHFPGM